MKIAVYTIAKNEAKHVARWAESCKEADYRLILDTGSTDNTCQIAWDCDVTIETETFDPWRFDHARNVALTCLPDDIDLCISLDMDEVLTPGWRKVLENLSPDINMVRHKVVTTFNPDGTEGQSFTIGRIHGRHSHIWKYPIHEILTPVALENSIYVTGLEIHHHPDNSKPRTQYLEMLKLAAEENPNDERNQFYLAREYFFHERYALAQHHFSRHLAISQWNPERAASHRYMAQMRPDAAEHHLYKAVAEDPTRRENWVELAKVYYARQDWVSTRSACEMAFRTAQKQTDYFCEEEAWGYLPYDLAALACYHLGDTDQAWAYGAEALALNPGDERLEANLTWYRL
jgi:tetratricopeptide (TPR) repeat protein